MLKKFYFVLFALMNLSIALNTFAQDTAANKKVEMADAMRSNGKIYVVVTVLVIILIGIIFYVARLDRKIGKLEKEMSGK